MENESLFIWSNDINKCWFGYMKESEETDTGELVKVQITKGKVIEGSIKEMFFAREHNLSTDSLGYHPS